MTKKYIFSFSISALALIFIACILLNLAFHQESNVARRRANAVSLHEYAISINKMANVPQDSPGTIALTDMVALDTDAIEANAGMLWQTAIFLFVIAGVQVITIGLALSKYVKSRKS